MMLSYYSDLDTIASFKMVDIEIKNIYRLYSELYSFIDLMKTREFNRLGDEDKRDVLHKANEHKLNLLIATISCKKHIPSLTSEDIKYLDGIIDEYDIEQVNLLCKEYIDYIEQNNENPNHLYTELTNLFNEFKEIKGDISFKNLIMKEKL